MDTSMTALTRTINQIGAAFDEFKKTNDERLEAVKSGNDSLAGELSQKLTRIEGDVTKWSALKRDIEAEQKLMRERIEDLESRQNMPGKTAAEKIANEYRTTFVDWIRNKGQSSAHEEKLRDLTRKAAQADERKSVTIGSSAGGGFAVPEEIAREIERLELKFSPVRSLVKVVQTGTSDYKELVSIRGTTSGWVGESGSRTETATSQLRERTPTNGELYAYPQASEWSLDDVFFNVEQWLAEEVAESFAVEEGTAVISGNGTNQPTGMLNTTPVTTADFASPLRAAAAFQYIACVSTQSPAVAELLPDRLIDTVYALNSTYRAMATWIMNSATTGIVRKMKDTQGQYLWAPGLQAGQPDRLLGYAVSTWEQMSDVGTNNFPIGFGNWRRAYVIADRVGLRVTRDNVTTPGFVKFYVRRREGGTVLNNDAAKFIRTTLS
jgi:HK97 family phage major capsid protein